MALVPFAVTRQRLDEIISFTGTFDFRLAFLVIMQPAKPAFLTILLTHILDPTWAEYFLHTVINGVVGSGNYTYYKITKEHNVKLVLETLSGDTDLYISDKTLTPDFENYACKSTTCGDEEVYIPMEWKRPIGVGVYGYISFDVSRYKLYFYTDDKKLENTFTHRGGHHKGDPEEEEPSWLETIGTFIFKVLIEALG